MSVADNSFTAPRPVDPHRAFAFLRAARRDRDLSPGAKVLIDVLVDMTDKRGVRQLDPCLSVLAEACGSSRTTVLRWAGELEQRGLIVVTTREARRLSAVYSIRWEAYDDLAAVPAPARKRRELPRRPDGAFVKAAPAASASGRSVAQPGRAVGVSMAEPEPVKTAEAKASVAIQQELLRWHSLSAHAELRAEAPELLAEAVQAEVSEAGAGYPLLRAWLFARASSAGVLAAE